MPRVFLLVGLMLAVAAAGQPGRTTAQEASPPASPIVALDAGACVGPPVLAGTPAVRAAEPPSDATAVSAAEPTVQASAEPGVPADPELIERVEVAAHNLINCLNAQDFATVIALHTPQALLRLFGTAEPREAAAMLEGFPLSELHAVENVRVLADGRISAVVSFTVGNELMRSRDYWIDQEGTLLYDGFDVLPVLDATPAD